MPDLPHGGRAALLESAQTFEPQIVEAGKGGTYVAAPATVVRERRGEKRIALNATFDGIQPGLDRVNGRERAGVGEGSLLSGPGAMRVLAGVGWSRLGRTRLG